MKKDLYTTRAQRQKNYATQSDQAYHEIRDAIMYSRLKPGERLIETEACSVFEIGRTPFREAIRRLQMEGYVDITPNKGAVITGVSIRDIEEIYNIVAVLEGYAAETAALNTTEEDIKKLKSFHEQLIVAGQQKNHRDWLEKNSLFHAYIPKVADNLHLSKMISSLRDKIYRYRYIAITIPGHIQEYIASHQDILEAISKREPIKAGEAMRRHVFFVRDVLVDFLTKSPIF